MRILRQMVPQKRNKTRYNLLDSEGFFASVSVETALRYHLKEGMELPDELLEEMRREDTLKYAKEIGVAYVAYAPRTRREVEQHLARKGIDEKSIEQAVQALEEYSYLDDAAYVREFVRSYAGRLGAGAIRRKLAEKGVPQQVIEENLELFAKEQREAARAVAEKLRRKYRAEPEQARRRKMFAALCRRGFSYEDIRQVVDLPEEDADELF